MKVRYNEISQRTWNSQGFRGLSDDAKLLWLFFLTGPIRTPLPGIYNIGAGGCLDYLRWEPKKFQDAWDELEGLGMAVADWDINVLYLPNWSQHNRPPNSSNVLKGRLKLLGNIPDCDLKALYISQLKNLCEELGETFEESFREWFGESFTEGIEMIPYRDKVMVQVVETDEKNGEIKNEFMALSENYHERVKEIFPKLSHLAGAKRKKTVVIGAMELEKLHRINGYDIGTISNALSWVIASYDESNDFNWLPNLQSLSSIRRKSKRNGNLKFENILNSAKEAKPKKSLEDFRTAVGGHFIGYCADCGVSDFYDKFEVWQDSRCCQSGLLPKKGEMK